MPLREASQQGLNTFNNLYSTPGAKIGSGINNLFTNPFWSNFSNYNKGNFSFNSDTPFQGNFNVRLNDPSMSVNDMYVNTGSGTPIAYSEFIKNPSEYGSFWGGNLSLTDSAGKQNFGTISQNSWLGDNLGTIGQGISAASGLWQAYNAWRNNQLIEEQLDFQKEATNRNLANQAKMINNAYEAKNNLALAMSDTLSSAQKEKMRNDIKNWYVDGSPIG